jgi:uncharacterized protein
MQILGRGRWSTRACCSSVLLILSAGAVGCGSSGDSSSTSTSTTSTAQTGTVTALRAGSGEDLARFPELPAPATAPLPSPPREPRLEREYLTAVFDDAQSVWRREFAAAHLRYTAARLVIFWSQIHSRCGPHTGSGPFYCPADDGVYLDLRFFQVLQSDAHGPVAVAAQAYIVGHELGHHVQRLIGIADRVDAANRADPTGRNARSVHVELQADCLSGVWARSAYPRSGLSPSDLDQALKTAHVIGDDYVARAVGNIVDTSVFTHGSSAQREHWLTTGYRSGRPAACNTFAAR